MASETLSVSAIVFCIYLPINRKNKRQFNFLPLVKYLYFIFRITPTIDIEPKSEYTLDEIAEIRKEKSAQAVQEFFEFCEENQGRNLPKSLTGRAISYALNQRVTLEAFLKNPKIELTNNSAERALKPFVIGRKNRLFCNSEAGAQASSIIYLIIETAKANNINPYDWLEQIFISIQQGVDTIKSLL